MPDTREKLIELFEHDDCPLFMVIGHNLEGLADYLIANGVIIQDVFIEELSKKMHRLHSLLLGADKAFNERMAGYTPSSFCAGYDYAFELAKGLLTQLSELPSEGNSYE